MDSRPRIFIRLKSRLLRTAGPFKLLGALIAVLSIAGVAGTTPTQTRTTALELGISPTATPTPGSKFVRTGSMSRARESPIISGLATGTVLVAGGADGRAVSRSAELYDPATGKFVATGKMTAPREDHTGTFFPSGPLAGQVLVVGGFDGRRVLSTAELYDPGAGSFSRTGRMTIRHAFHTANLLNNGQVLVVGGIIDGNIKNALASAELYDPPTRSFMPAGKLAGGPRAFHTATLLKNGMVLVAGGSDRSGKPVATAELYNASYKTFTPTGDMSVSRRQHTATLLKDGRVLITGGIDSSNHVLASAETYDPETGKFTPVANMTTPRQFHGAQLLTDGTVLILGGNSGNGRKFLASAEIFDPVKSSFSPAGDMTMPRQEPSTALISGPVTEVLIAGGQRGRVSLRTAELFTPPPIPANGCVPSSSLSVLVQGSNVSSYVPNGSWTEDNLNIQLVPIEGSGGRATIATPNPVNSCSSNSTTGETVCTANNTDVYLINGSTLIKTLTSGATGFAGFSGGDCQNCGTVVDASTNTAWLGIGTTEGSAYQLLDLGTETFSAPVMSATQISEDIAVDPIRHLVLSPSEGGTYEILKTQPEISLFENPIAGRPVLDSAAEDCTTGIALSTSEFTGNLFITDLTQATFTPGSPGSWMAPSQIQSFPDFAGFSAGTDAIAIAPNTHLGVVTGEFGGNAFGVILLPSTSGSGTPAVVDWAAARIPNEPTGAAFNIGLDPHTVTAFVSPTSGKAFALIADDPRAFLAVVDLEALLAAPRVPGTHTVDPSVDLVGTGIVRFVSLF